MTAPNPQSPAPPLPEAAEPEINACFENKGPMSDTDRQALIFATAREPVALPSAWDYATKRQFAVTKEWCRGWDDARAYLATQPLAAPVRPAEWQTPPASWRMLAKAAIDLLCAVDEKHDAQRPPHKYAVPYGAVNDLRRALGAATPPAHPVLAPVVREPLTATPTQFIAAHTYLRGCEIDMSGAELDNLLRIFGIQATTGEQSHG